ncbi:MAG: MaoC family dehydratase N-terminal domain-containing protein [Phenylobacterium sp.]
MSESKAPAEDGWKAAWQPMIDRIGEDFAVSPGRYAVDLVEAGAIRKYLEPLEFDCPLHYDPEVARAQGHADVIAPYTSLTTFAAPPVWKPGEAVFDSAERNAQPARPSVRPRSPSVAPPTSGVFATDTDFEFLRPVTAGERLGRRGNRLVACTPKETKVGRGAFVTWESEIMDEQGETVAYLRTGLFLYNPHPKG